MRAIPTAAEILAVIAHYLRDDLATRQDTADKFHLLVAANAVEIAGRDLELGAAADAAALARLRALLGDDASTLEELDQRLCVAIASGALSLEDVALRDHLVITTLDEITIDQPRYASAARMREMIGKQLSTAISEGSAS